MMVAILLCCSNQVKAAQEGDYTYTEADGKAQITKYTGAGGVLTIPNKLEGYIVTSIGDNAFYGCAGLTTVNISKEVKSIGYNAFYKCTGLTDISLPEGVTSICNNAFYGCAGLTTVNIPKGVTSIGANAFHSCTSLTTVNIPEGVTSIGDNAFYSCTSLTDISIPNGVTNIGDNTFYNCIGLTNVNFPKGLKRIGDNAFHSCTGLTNISLPEGVLIIGNNAFYKCKNLSLSDISNLNGVISIGDNAFYGCAGLTDMGNLQGVGIWVFWVTVCVTIGFFITFFVIIRKGLKDESWSLKDAISETVNVNGNTESVASSSRLIALVGLAAILAIDLGIAITIFYSSLVENLKGLDLQTIGAFLVAQAALFAPYIANKISAVAESKAAISQPMDLKAKPEKIIL